MRLPKIETLVIMVFLGAVLLWAVSKCSAKRAQLASRERTESESDYERPAPKRDTVFVSQQPATVYQTQPGASPLPGPNPQVVVAPAPQVYSQPGRTPQTNPQPTAEIPTPAKTPSTAAASKPTVKYSTLFVTIDGLKVRKEPGLKSAIVSKLELYEPVSFLNQKTEWTQEISLGTEKVTDHWVKVRTQAGREGWVFGAGVHYYKMKRKGTLE